ncbi:hypothetical protein G6L37_06540 [Agrobacterium rubi]|nr:hypothetical protein [Agrobacterium rubi]NTF25021.1 hypothetical protein [Agrobacterium rubi]
MSKNQIMQHAQLLAAFALKSEGREIRYDLAGRLAYLADRLCLERHGFPVVSDRRIAVMGSAVNCGTMRTVFDGFNPEVRGAPMFSEIGALTCRVSDHVLAEDLDLHSVSIGRIIDETWTNHADLGVEGIERLMSQPGRYPEISPAGMGCDITIKDMLDALGFEDAEEMAAEIDAYERIDLIFSVLEVR